MTAYWVQLPPEGPFNPGSVSELGPISRSTWPHACGLMSRNATDAYFKNTKMKRSPATRDSEEQRGGWCHRQRDRFHRKEKGQKGLLK